MRTHNVSVLVLEGISYYRATLVFPDLAAGKANPPFQSLGDQRWYQVSSGKPVYAYRLGAKVTLQSIYPGLDAAIAPMPAQGKTAPLAKGVTLTAAGSTLAGEGMGFGVPIVHYPDGWVYSRTATTLDVSTVSAAIWKRTYLLDEIGGDLAHNYAFVPIASRGSVEVTYTIDSSGVSISVRALELTPGYTEVAILNEQSAAFNDFADPGRTLVGPAFGNWVPVDGPWARVQSRSLGVQWSVPAISGALLHGGRELVAPDFDWAGLDYLFKAPFGGASYHINVQEAR
jgi:hypothetical protein